MDPWQLLSLTIFCFLAVIHQDWAQVREVISSKSASSEIASLGIDCFDCHSIDGSNPECEDEFGPIEDKKALLKRNCKVGYLQFRAHFCVKIKGTKPNGQSILIRTCSFEDWGTVCGSVIFEHGHEDNKEKISGCLETCNFDGCNTARILRSNFNVLVLAALCSAFLYLRVRWIM